MLKSSITSQNTGVAPTKATEEAVAKNEFGGTITSSPSLIPYALNAKIKASVPELRLNTNLEFVSPAKEHSNSLTAFPRIKSPLSNTSPTAFNKSSLIAACCRVSVI